jgi:hypothetical protein
MLKNFVWVVVSTLLGFASLVLSQNTGTVSSVKLSDGTEYFPVMATDFAGEVLSFNAPNAIELGSEAVVQELINMNLARDAVIDERAARLIPIKVILEVKGGFVNLAGLNLRLLEITGDPEVTLPEEGETTVMVSGDVTLRVPTSRSVVIAQDSASSATLTIDKALTTTTTNPVTLKASEGSSVLVEVRPY